MKLYPLLYTLPALLCLPVAQADISLGRPAAPKDANAYHSDLLASNAVLAAFKEIRTVPVVDLSSAAPASQEIAVFEVKQNLAHRRYDRMGDAALQPGRLFSVSLAGDVPGQDASLGEQIRSMKPGDEAVMKMDHIYIFREEGNENVRSCTRFKKAEGGAPSAADAAPSAGATPIPPAVKPAAAGLPFPTSSAARSSSYSVETNISMQRDEQGVLHTQKVEIRRELTEDGMKVRKFINDVEVDPATDQPLQSAPAAAPQPDAEADKPKDDLPPIPEPPKV